MTDRLEKERYLGALEREQDEDQFWSRLDERIGPYIRTLNLALSIAILYFISSIAFEPVPLYSLDPVPSFRGVSGVILAVAAGEMYSFISINKGDFAKELKVSGLDRRHSRACLWTLIVNVFGLVMTLLIPFFAGKAALFLTVSIVSYQLTLVAVTAANLKKLSDLRSLHDSYASFEMEAESKSEGDFPSGSNGAEVNST